MNSVYKDLRNSMCGIVGVYTPFEESAYQETIEQLLALQHRGQDAVGLTIGGKIIKGVGLVSEVFKTHPSFDIDQPLTIGIGHVRYPTNGELSQNEIQPLVFVSDHLYISLAHNGQINNYEGLKEVLISDGYQFHTKSDSEVLLYLLHRELGRRVTLDETNIKDAVNYIRRTVSGSYSVVAHINNSFSRMVGMLAFKDPWGIRPLSYYASPNRVLVASEDIAIDGDTCDLMHNEILWATVDNEKDLKCHLYTIPGKSLRPCMFEYIYLARADATIYGANVQTCRYNMGLALGEIIKADELDVDMVVPVPSTGRIFAQGVAKVLDVPYVEALVKNRYVARSFIMPNPERRSEVLRRKFNPIKHLITGKRILLVDDSIVRGNTARELIYMLYSLGASSVYFASGSPPIKYINKYGIDIQDESALVAKEYGTDLELINHLGASGVFYNTLEAVGLIIYKEISEYIKNQTVQLEASCFNGEYII